MPSSALATTHIHPLSLHDALPISQGDLQRRGPRPRPGRGQSVRARLRHQVPQGGRQDHRRPRRAPGVLPLPGRALDSPAHDQPDRRSEEHTSELQSRGHLVCRLLLSPPPTSTPFPYTTLFRSLKEIYNAEDLDHAQVAVKAFELDYGTKYPKAVAKITDDLDVLLEFYRYPAEHWIHLRTTNPIESTFATVRLRTKVTKGPGSRAAGLAMAYKLIDAASAR